MQMWTLWDGTSDDATHCLELKLLYLANELLLVEKFV